MGPLAAQLKVRTLAAVWRPAPDPARLAARCLIWVPRRPRQ